MNYKRLAAATFAAFVFSLMWNSAVHGVVLSEAGQALSAIARPPAERSLALGLCITLAVAALFMWSYARHAEHGVKAALRHGAWFALVAGVLVDLNQYFVYPIPGALALAWFAFGALEFLIYGLIAGWIYKPPPADA